MSARFIVLGAAVFGVTTARELARRGHAVTLVDSDAPPTPSASSTDISKVVRADYDDPFYIELADRAWEGWQRWNRDWQSPPLRESGALLIAGGPMGPDTWEGRVHRSLEAQGADLLRIDATVLRDRFPAFRASVGIDGYFNPRAGWVPSSAVVTELARRAAADGVTMRFGARAARILDTEHDVQVELTDGSVLEGDRVVVCAGAWTGRLVEDATPLLLPVAQPVLHLRVPDPAPFMPPAFPVWAVDLTGEGWYGFPALPDGTLKIGNHGPGHLVDPDHPGDVTDEQEATCRAFLRHAIPELAEAPRIASRHCLYCDGPDGDFVIDRVPGRERLVIAAGGSGHAFKYAPILGTLVADVAEDGVALPRFGWREVAGAVRR